MGEGVDAGLGVNFNDVINDLEGGGEATLSLVLAFGDRVSEGAVLDSRNDFRIAVAKGERAGFVRGSVDGDFVILIDVFRDEGSKGFGEAHIKGVP